MLQGCAGGWHEMLRKMLESFEVGRPKQGSGIFTITEDEFKENIAINTVLLRENYISTIFAYRNDIAIRVTEKGKKLLLQNYVNWIWQ